MITPKSVLNLLRVPLPAVPNGQQPVRILICGVLPSVNHIVHQLHVRRFAEAGEWSPPLPSPLEGKVIRMLLGYCQEGDSRRSCFANRVLRS